jgi:hypothetical protein
MDTPMKNSEGYRNADLKNFVKKLKGDLLIIMMIRTEPLYCSKFDPYHEVIKKQSSSRYFIYPQHDHNVVGKTGCI